jgi:phosphohistidine phosphatase
MRIVFFRHGPAGRRDAKAWPDDGLRPLTERGRRRTELAARGLRRLASGWTAILTSPLARAHQTAEIAARTLAPARGLEIVEALSPGGSRRETLARLARHAPEALLVVVGHEPELGDLAGTLAFGPGIRVPLKKAGACCVRLEEGGPRPGAGTLEWLLTPRTLRRLGRGRGRT